MDSRLLGDAGEDTEPQNFFGQLTNPSRRLKNQGVVKSPLCNVCCKTCVSSSDLENKERIGLRPHTGDVFHKSYNTEEMKQNSTRTVERPYVCDICTETSCILTSHRQMHTGERPHKCDVTRDLLNLIILRHTYLGIPVRSRTKM